MRDVDFEGIWWLASSADRQVEGTLRCSVDEPLDLTLRGSLVGIESVNDLGPLGTVHGLTDRGKPLTLVDARTAAFQHHFPGRAAHRVTGRAVFVGDHLEDAPTVTSAHLDFDFLPEWFGSHGLKEHVDPATKTFELRYQRPEISEAHVRGCRVGIGVSWRVSGDMVTGRSLELDPKLTLDLDEPMPFDSLMADWVSPLRDFLTLGVDRPCTLVEVKVARTAEPRPDDWLEALFPVQRPPVRRGRPPHWSDMVFDYDRIAGSFERMLSGWMRVRDDLREPCELYFGTRYRQAFLSIRFLMLVQAVEVWDRRTNPNHVLDPAAWKAKLDSYVDAVEGSKRRRWLRGQLKYANEPALKDRIGRLVDEVGVVTARLVERDAFARLVSDTRNYLTHHDPAMRSKAADGERLYWTCEQLALLLAALMLKRIGSTDDELRDLFDRYQRYLGTIPRLRELGYIPLDPVAG